MAQRLINTQIKIGRGVLHQDALTGLKAQIHDAEGITLQSNDRNGWLSMPSGLYFIGATGLSMGYPSDYFMLFHMKWNSNLIYQLGVTNSNNNGTNWLRYRLINNNVNSRIAWSTL